MTIDDRSYVMQAVATMPIFISITYIYPRLFPLHDIDPQDTELPPMLRCSIDKFTDDGAYLLGNIKMIHFTQPKLSKLFN
jgi:protein transport protein SEC24